MCQNSMPSGGGRSLGAKISGGRGRPWGIFFGFYKTRHILLVFKARLLFEEKEIRYVRHKTSHRRKSRENGETRPPEFVLGGRL